MINQESTNSSNSAPNVAYSTSDSLPVIPSASQRAAQSGAIVGQNWNATDENAAVNLITPTTLISLEETFSERVANCNNSESTLQPKSLKRKFASGASRYPELPNNDFDSLSFMLDTPGSKSDGTDEKKRIRRERNKIAAAKCRQKRVDLINSLQDEVDRLDADGTSLTDEISNLSREKEQLEFVLQAHRPICRLEKVPLADRPINLSTNSNKSLVSNPKKVSHRPSCLPVASSSKTSINLDTPSSLPMIPPKKSPSHAKHLENYIKKKETGELNTPTIVEGAGIALSTPSKDIACFDLGTSGLTPTAEYQTSKATASCGALRKRSSSSSTGSEMPSPIIPAT